MDYILSKYIILKDGKQATQINLSDFEAFGHFNPQTSAVFTGNAGINTFIRAIKSAKRIEGILDMAHAQNNFYIVFKDVSTKGYHLWLHTSYSFTVEVISEQDTKNIKDAAWEAWNGGMCSCAIRLSKV